MPEAKHVKGFAQQVDIPATIFEVTDVSLEKTIGKMREHAKTFGNPAYGHNIGGFTDGKNLLSLVKGDMIHENVFAETGTVYLRRGGKDQIEVGILGQRAIRTCEWKLITYSDGRKELFDVRDDPMEVINLAEEKEDVLESLSEKLDFWIKSNLKGREDPMLRLPTALLRSSSPERQQPRDVSMDFRGTIPL